MILETYACARGEERKGSESGKGGGGYTECEREKEGVRGRGCTEYAGRVPLQKFAETLYIYLFMFVYTYRYTYIYKYIYTNIFT